LYLGPQRLSNSLRPKCSGAIQVYLLHIVCTTWVIHLNRLWIEGELRSIWIYFSRDCNSLRNPVNKAVETYDIHVGAPMTGPIPARKKKTSR